MYEDQSTDHHHHHLNHDHISFQESQPDNVPWNSCSTGHARQLQLVDRYGHYHCHHNHRRHLTQNRPDKDDPHGMEAGENNHHHTVELPP